MRRQHCLGVNLLRITLVGKLFSVCLLIMVFGVSTLLTQAALAQDTEQYTLPENWQSLSADDFVAMSQGSWRNFSADQRTALTDHAWSQFLSKRDFVSGEWSSVKPMVDFYGPRSSNHKAQSKALAEFLSEQGQVMGSSFDEVFTLTKTLQRGSKGEWDPGQIWAKWMQENPWQRLSFPKQVALLSGTSADQFDRFNMSARWTGALTAPRKGNYTFLFVRGAFGGNQYKLSVNGRVVFDSATSAVEPDAGFLRSDTIRLRKNAVPFELEMSFSKANAAKGPAFPAAALMWEADKVSRELIPSSAFTPPEGFGDGESTGLKGQYYDGTEFGKLVAERLDSNLEFAWTASPVVSIHDQYAELLAGCRKVDIVKQFKALKAGDKSETNFVLKSVASLLKRLPLSERAALLSRLSKQKKTLKRISPYWAGIISSGVCLLPDGEGVEFLDAWSQACGMPNFAPGDPRVKPRGLHKQVSKQFQFSHNWEFHWSIGKRLVGPLWSCSQSILDEKLEMDDGQCNLTLLYIATFAAFEDQARSHQPRVAQVKQLLNEKLRDESLTGDARVSWLIGRAFVEEAGASHPPLWGKGNNYLKEATLVASTDGYKFWGVQELAARYAAKGQHRLLEQLATGLGSKFSAPEQKQMLQSYLDMVKHSQEVFAKQQKKQRQKDNATYVARLEQRIAQARSSGQTEAAARFEKILLAAKQAAQAEPE